MKTFDYKKANDNLFKKYILPNLQYLKINKKQLGNSDKAQFYKLYETIKTQIDFDNTERQLKLTKKDIDVLAWNCAVMIIEPVDNYYKIE